MKHIKRYVIKLYILDNYQLSGNTPTSSAIAKIASLLVEDTTGGSLVELISKLWNMEILFSDSTPLRET